MRILSKIKQYLPPSSRSFHEMFRYLYETSWKIEGIDERLARLEKASERQAAQLERHLSSQDTFARAHDTHMKMLSWALYRQEGESYEEAKKRFFRELPPATGSSRLLQLGCAQLLGEFDELCQQHGLQYWACWGTLLGAVRHQGFIPWDDDVDVGMARADILKLMDIVASDSRHRITVVYDRRAICRQVRFWYKDESVPCFLDIFIYDYVGIDDVALFERNHKALRAELREALDYGAIPEWTRNADVPSSDPLAKTISQLFDEYDAKQTALNEGLPSGDRAKALVWSVDNIDRGVSGHWRLRTLDDYFPTVHLPFEGGSIAVPNAYQAQLAEFFGDYLSLPMDIHGNINQHFKPGLLEEAKTQQVLERLVSADR